MDTLQRIPEGDLQLLIDLYSKHQSVAPHIFSLFITCTAWKKKNTDSEFLQFFGINKDWVKSGTFILLFKYGSNTLFLFTLEENYESLREAVTQTKLIDWKKKTIWFTITLKHLPTVTDIVKELNPASFRYLGASFWMMKKEDALQLETNIPDDVYVKSLDKSHVDFINAHWPHKHENSEVYLSTFIEMDISYGIFLKSDNSLVCWILKCMMGCLSNLQTQPEHRKKGYAALLAKFMAKKIAQGGYDPLSIIMEGNVASEALFEKIGFRKYEDCVYVDCFP